MDPRKSLENVMAKNNLLSDDIKFTYEYNKDTIPFLDLKVTSSNFGKLITSLKGNLLTVIIIFTTGLFILNILKGL